MRVSSQSDTSLVVQWSPPELLQRNGPIDGYEVYFTYRNGTHTTHAVSGQILNLQIEGNEVDWGRGVKRYGSQNFPSILKVFRNLPS